MGDLTKKEVWNGVGTSSIQEIDRQGNVVYDGRYPYGNPNYASTGSSGYSKPAEPSYFHDTPQWLKDHYKKHGV